MLRIAFFVGLLNSAIAFSLAPSFANNFPTTSYQRAPLVSRAGVAASFRKPSALSLRAQDSSIDDKTAGAVAAVSFVALPVMLWSEFTLK
jgi:hypothetical protein